MGVRGAGCITTPGGGAIEDVVVVVGNVMVVLVLVAAASWVGVGLGEKRSRRVAGEYRGARLAILT